MNFRYIISVARGWHINAPSGRTNTHPFIYDRRTKEHNTPSLREGWGGLHITPNPSPREGR